MADPSPSSISAPGLTEAVSALAAAFATWAGLRRRRPRAEVTEALREAMRAEAEAVSAAVMSDHERAIRRDLDRLTRSEARIDGHDREHQQHREMMARIDARLDDLAQGLASLPEAVAARLRGGRS